MTTITFASKTTDVTRRLLGAGVIAGPIFVSTAAIQVVTRDGFDLRRHPLSMLALGQHGWIQVINFILAGVLSLIFAVGVARRLPDGPGSTWAPRLLALYGAGLVIGGVFTRFLAGLVCFCFGTGNRSNPYLLSRVVGTTVSRPSQPG